MQSFSKQLFDKRLRRRQRKVSPAEEGNENSSHPSSNASSRTGSQASRNSSPAPKRRRITYAADRQVADCAVVGLPPRVQSLDGINNPKHLSPREKNECDKILSAIDNWAVGGDKSDPLKVCFGMVSWYLVCITSPPFKSRRRSVVSSWTYSIPRMSLATWKYILTHMIP